MRVAIDLVHEGRASAAVSAGNTGALTAIAHFVLKTLPGVERAAIISALPAAHGLTQMLDLGANTKATAEQLRQFAAMGAIIARDVYGIVTPAHRPAQHRRGGHEGPRDRAGGARAAGASALNYVGFVEGDDIFSGEVDVVVTDGFTGNVALKSMEGVAGLIADRMRQEFQASLLARLAGLVARPVLRRAAASLDPRRYNGACMVGLGGIVVKSHGRADGVAFARAIATAAPRGATRPHRAHRAGAAGTGDGQLIYSRIAGTGSYLPGAHRSPTASWRRWSTRPMSGSARAPASSAATSPPTARPRWTWPSMPRGAPSRRPAWRPRTSTSSPSAPRRRTWFSPTAACCCSSAWAASAARPSVSRPPARGSCTHCRSPTST